MIGLLRKLIRNKRGATAVEYGLIVSLVVIACVSAMSQMAASTNGMWNNIAGAVSKN